MSAILPFSPPKYALFEEQSQVKEVVVVTGSALVPTILPLHMLLAVKISSCIFLLHDTVERHRLTWKICIEEAEIMNILPGLQMDEAWKS